MSDSIKTALATLSMLRECHGDKETRMQLIESLEGLLNVAAKKFAELEKINKENQERLLKISQIIDQSDYTTFSMGTDLADADDDFKLE